MAELFAVTPAAGPLVTGGASGIGLGTARRLLELGAAVAVADLTQAIAGMSAQDRADLVAIPMDVTSESAVAEGVAHAVEGLGSLDTLVNCAGVFQFRALEDISTTEWDTILSVNLRGTFLVMRRSDAASQGIRTAGGSSTSLRTPARPAFRCSAPIAHRNSRSSG